MSRYYSNLLCPAVKVKLLSLFILIFFSTNFSIAVLIITPLTHCDAKWGITTSSRPTCTVLFLILAPQITNNDSQHYGKILPHALSYQRAVHKLK